MKRLVLPLVAVAAAIAMLPAFAQTTVNPNAKVDPKNNKVSNPVVEKPKAKPQLNRDQLRACMERSDNNAKEAEAIKGLQASYKSNSAALQKEKADILKADEDLVAESAAAKKEREGILAMFEEIKAAAPKLSKEDLAAKNKEYQDRAAAFDARVTAVNDKNKALNTRRTTFSDKVDALNAEFKAMEERTEGHFDKMDSWKAECANKTYEEADELAIKKERAAAGK